MKTAVEEVLKWVKDELQLFGSAKQILIDKLNQAKEMEKSQHDNTAEEWWKEGAHYMESGGKCKWESFEQYYNETFKQQEQ